MVVLFFNNTTPVATVARHGSVCVGPFVISLHDVFSSDFSRALFWILVRFMSVAVHSTTRTQARTHVRSHTHIQTNTHVSGYVSTSKLKNKGVLPIKASSAGKKMKID